jgi:hypothetical protein
MGVPSSSKERTEGEAMKKLMLTTISALCLLACCYSAEAQKNRVTCTGILIEVDMNPSAVFPMAVVYDNTDSLAPHTCVGRK